MIYVQTVTSGPVSVSNDEAREALRERRRRLIEGEAQQPSAEPEPRLVYKFQTPA